MTSGKTSGLRRFGRKHLGWKLNVVARRVLARTREDPDASVLRLYRDRVGAVRLALAYGRLPRARGALYHLFTPVFFLLQTHSE